MAYASYQYGPKKQASAWLQAVAQGKNDKHENTFFLDVFCIEQSSFILQLWFKQNQTNGNSISDFRRVMIMDETARRTRSLNAYVDYYHLQWASSRLFRHCSRTVAAHCRLDRSSAFTLTQRRHRWTSRRATRLQARLRNLSGSSTGKMLPPPFSRCKNCSLLPSSPHTCCENRQRKIVTPSEYTSYFSVMTLGCAYASGAAKGKESPNLWVFVGWPSRKDSPKSQTLTRNFFPTMRLAGLRSRWTIPVLCSSKTPLAACSSMNTFWKKERCSFLCKNNSKDQFSSYSEKRLPRSSAASDQKQVITFGWLRFFNLRKVPFSRSILYVTDLSFFSVFLVILAQISDCRVIFFPFPVTFSSSVSPFFCLLIGSPPSPNSAKCAVPLSTFPNPPSASGSHLTSPANLITVYMLNLISSQKSVAQSAMGLGCSQFSLAKVSS